MCMKESQSAAERTSARQTRQAYKSVQHVKEADVQLKGSVQGKRGKHTVAFVSVVRLLHSHTQHFQLAFSCAGQSDGAAQVFWHGIVCLVLECLVFAIH